MKAPGEKQAGDPRAVDRVADDRGASRDQARMDQARNRQQTDAGREQSLHRKQGSRRSSGEMLFRGAESSADYRLRLGDRGIDRWGSLRRLRFLKGARSESRVTDSEVRSQTLDRSLDGVRCRSRLADSCTN